MVSAVRAPTGAIVYQAGVSDRQVSFVENHFVQTFFPDEENDLIFIRLWM